MDGQNDTPFTTKDHDILIRVEENVREIKASFQDMKDGVTKQLGDHEVRIKGLEAIESQTSPVDSFKEFQLLKQSFKDSQTTARTERKLWGIVGGIVGGVMVAIISQIISHVIFTK